MSDSSPESNDPEWLQEFEELANQRLEHGSSCEQVHPIIERWYAKLLEGDPPQSRDSVVQAMACLSTEILYSLPEEMLDELTAVFDEDELADLIEHILLVGRAFEIALRNGDLDDL